MNSIFNKEFLYRIISVLIFIPIVILPLLFSNYAALIIYLLIASIILSEIHRMKVKVKDVNIFNIYILISITSFFLFLLILVTEKLENYTIIALIFIIWLFDTFSYLGGKIIGGIKLMPRISSGKTFSGLIIGVLMTLLSTEIILYLFNISYSLSIIYTLIIIVLAFMGDVSVSILKRYASIKDSGNIMPGHGGLLDRFDSFIAVFFIIGIINLFT